MLKFLLTLCLFLQTAITRSTDDLIYLVTVTSQTVGGSKETLCAQIHHAKEPVSFVVTLEMEDGGNTTLLEELAVAQFYRCVQFRVPLVIIDTVARIRATVQVGETSLNKTTKILIQRRPLISVIQTDKPIYKPGQTVKFRIVSMDSNFLPANEVFQTVELLDPVFNRIAQWLNQSTASGILDLSHPTTPETSQGAYHIAARNREGARVTQSFEIKEYVLPNFEVKIHIPDVISFADREVQYKICGRYTYGKPVQGTVTVQLNQRNIVYFFFRSSGLIRYFQEMIKTDETGCATHTIKLEQFGLGYSYSLEVESEMVEHGTGVIVKAERKVLVKTDKLLFEFQDAPINFKRGIEYEGKVIVKNVPSFPVSNKTISLSAAYGYTGKTETWTLTTDIEGVARFSLDTSLWEDFVTLQAYDHMETSSTGYARTDYEKAVHHVHEFYSKSQSFMTIKQAEGPLSCDQDSQVLVRYFLKGEELKGHEVMDFFYLVMSRGSIVQHGRTRVAVGSGSEKTGQLSVPLRQMADLTPYAQVMVYTVLPNREVVADSSDFPIQRCFKNRVSVQFSSPQELPGERTSLELRAQPGSLCSLRAVDQSVFLMSPERDLARTVFDRLPVSKLSSYPYNVEDYEPAPCISRKQRSLNEFKKSDTYLLFQGVGIKALTNLNMKKPVECHPGGSFGPGGSRMQMSLPDTIRSYFPETWIWELVPVGESGSVKLERTVPDTITKWVADAFCTSSAGFGLATNSSLTVFQPVFVSLTLPHSVIRGEELTLRAMVFNYLSKCIMVHVTLENSTNFKSEPCKGCVYRKCLCGEKPEVFSWLLTPTSLGEVSIKVSAEALSTEDLCGNEVATVPEKGGIDTVIRTLRVEPEGVRQTITHNALLCPQGGTVKKTISLELPEDIVEGSAKASLSVLGDLIGSFMRNVDGLLAMPYGCGEQNMLLFAPNIYILRYLDRTRQLTPQIKAKTVKYLENVYRGYQQQLNYKHEDGSYSAFGKKDLSGNTWLTALVMQSFGSARPYIFIDPEHIKKAKKWLVRQQQANGCFKSVGKLFNNEIKGADSNEVVLTAYVTAALLKLNGNITNLVVQRGLSCLKEASDQLNSTYTTALLSYTFTLAKEHDLRTRLIGQLDKEAKTSGGVRHWERAGASAVDSLDVEMTAYVLLALLSGPSLPGFGLGYSATIVRWLTQQQNSHGGFFSTQDTAVALQALTLFGAATFSPEGASTLTVASSNGSNRQFSIDQHNRLLYQEERLQEVPGNYNIEAEGTACVFAQIALHYNIPVPPEFSAFNMTTLVTGNCRGSERRSLTVSVDVRYTGTRMKTNMVIVSMRLLSGFLPEENSLTVMKADPAVKRIEEEDGHIIIYLDELMNMRPKRYILTIFEDVPVRNLKPAILKVYDYYKTSDKAVSRYSSPCVEGGA
ncbi:alpha-2-macroglobulin-like isoform X2 [Megalops cyprinoides]|uniref:alpha-2-macroglobulin-like isoform X2 n=1 Tax=Megalops cyprinoides TaxID=118141 RepID=UPI0018645E97|nr:alpha-2-macroglobulin-like isoform X2 [Megalops cyprinoides]